MKGFLITLSFSLIINISLGKASPEKINTEYYFIKTWGFLKYYHPAYAKGKQDTDKDFLDKYSDSKKLQSKEELNNFIYKWISDLNRKSKLRNIKSEKPSDKIITELLDTNWINDPVLKEKAGAELRKVYLGRFRKVGHYAKHGFFTNNYYVNELSYNDSVYPKEPTRVLTLARYWNIINYFFPYKNEMDINWNQSLKELLPKFQNANDTLSYQLAVLEMIVRIDDSHAYFYTPKMREYFGMKWVPIGFKVINKKLIVTRFMHDSLANINDLRIGDVINTVNDKSIDNIINEKIKLINGSNFNRKVDGMAYAILNGNTDSVKINITRDNKSFDKIVCRYNPRNFSKTWNYYEKPDPRPYYFLNDSIAYINMAVLRIKQIKTMMDSLKHTKGIIIDIRNYPLGTVFVLSQYLNKETKPFVRFTSPVFKNPGTYKKGKLFYAGKKRNKFHTWFAFIPTKKINSNYFKGKVVTLINESTQSQAEFSCMALKTAPNNTFVGSPTSGADGNVVLITLPGNYKSYYSGLGVFYPDGTKTQRVGIQPDVLIYPTIEGVRNGKDELLEKAISIINNN